MAILERIVQHAERSFEIERRFVARGFGNIKKSLTKYRQASHVLPHIVLTDLDQAECPARLRQAWGAMDLPARMLLRVAVREAESWLLGDREGFAKFASIPKVKVPVLPEALHDPKASLVSLIRSCRNRRLIAELVPRPGSALSIGPLYNERLCGFVETHWNVDTASYACPSLKRALLKLSTFCKRPTDD